MTQLNSKYFNVELYKKLKQNSDDSQFMKKQIKHEDFTKDDFEGLSVENEVFIDLTNTKDKEKIPKNMFLAEEDIKLEDEDKYLNEDPFDLDKTLESLTNEELNELIDKNEKELDFECKKDNESTETIKIDELQHQDFDEDNLNSSDVFIVLDVTGEICLENTPEKQKHITIEEKKEFYKIGFDRSNETEKRPLQECSRKLNLSKKRRVDEKEFSLQTVKTSKRYEGPFFYPDDYQNNTHPLWNKYKEREFSPFETVQNDWKNTTLSNPHVNLTNLFFVHDNDDTFAKDDVILKDDFFIKNDEVPLFSKEVHVTTVYERQIQKLRSILDDLDSQKQCVKRKRAMINNRKMKINGDILNCNKAKGHLEYLLSNYRNDKFDALFVSEYKIEKILEEKSKIEMYEDFYGRLE